MQQRKPAGVLNGWPFVGVASVAILAAVAAASHPPDVASAGSAVRSRRAPPWRFFGESPHMPVRVCPNAWTRWQRKPPLPCVRCGFHGVLSPHLWRSTSPVAFAREGNAITWTPAVGLCLHLQMTAHRR